MLVLMPSGMTNDEISRQSHKKWFK